MNNQNTGVILEEIQPKDLIFGSNERVKHTIMLKSGLWLEYYSAGELQSSKLGDSMGCVSFSAIKVLSAHFNNLISSKMLSIGNMQWLQEKGYLNKNGEFDASERFTTAMSGTSSKGNSGGAVWWSIRNHGVVPQQICPWNGESGKWFRDLTNVEQEAKDLGLEFVKRFDILYERVRTNLKDMSEAIKRSPIQVFIPTSCPYNRNRVQQYCGGVITHAVSKCEGLDRGYHPLFDHYIKQPQEEGLERFIRRVAKNYKFYGTGYICNVAEKLDIDKDGYVEMEDRKGRLRRFPAYFVKTITYLLTKRGFKLKGMPSKTTLKKAVERAVWTMVMGSAGAFVMIPINLEEPKRYLTALSIGMIAGALMGLKKFIKGYTIYDKKS